MRGRRIRQTCISTKKASIRVPKPMRWVMDLVSYRFSSYFCCQSMSYSVRRRLKRFPSPDPLQINWYMLLELLFAVG
uniref:Uncharacterized protein n=2 Tax=Aegilops tauschii subsp. strangulata TaxID=200361 RepID=A0A453TAV2_AEGTS